MGPSTPGSFGGLLRDLACRSPPPGREQGRRATSHYAVSRITPCCLVCHVGGGARAGQRLRRARGEVAVGGTQITARLCVIGQGITSVRQTPVIPGLVGCRGRPLGGPHWILAPPGGPLPAASRWPAGPVEGCGDSGDSGGAWPGGGRFGTSPDKPGTRPMPCRAAGAPIRRARSPRPLRAMPPLACRWSSLSPPFACAPLPALWLGVDRCVLGVVADLDAPGLGLLGYRDRQP